MCSRTESKQNYAKSKVFEDELFQSEVSWSRNIRAEICAAKVGESEIRSRRAGVVMVLSVYQCYSLGMFTGKWIPYKKFNKKILRIYKSEKSWLSWLQDRYPKWSLKDLSYMGKVYISSSFQQFIYFIQSNKKYLIYSLPRFYRFFSIKTRLLEKLKIQSWILKWFRFLKYGIFRPQTHDENLKNPSRAVYMEELRNNTTSIGTITKKPGFF